MSPEAALPCSSNLFFVYLFSVLALLLQMLGNGGPERITTLRFSLSQKKTITSFYLQAKPLLTQSKLLGKLQYIVVCSHLAHENKRKLSFHSTCLGFPL